jgi:hypothetical protein
VGNDADPLGMLASLDLQHQEEQSGDSPTTYEYYLAQTSP